MVVALIALFVALGGVAGAATTMITTKMIADNAVTRGKIAQNSINSAKIEDGSIQSKDLASNIRGEKGIAGPKGDKGETGATGARGPAGEKGDTGATGATGTSGAAGIQGPAGASGTNGTNGTDGRTLLSGSTNPGAGIGANGDFYINTASDTLFGPKVSGAWPAGESLVGPQGPAGSTGPQGIAGANGITEVARIGRIAPRYSWGSVAPTFSFSEGQAISNSTGRLLASLTLDPGKYLLMTTGTLLGGSHSTTTGDIQCRLQTPGYLPGDWTPRENLLAAMLANGSGSGASNSISMMAVNEFASETTIELWCVTSGTAFNAGIVAIEAQAITSLTS
jgi:hypothetical protein